MSHKCLLVFELEILNLSMLSDVFVLLPLKVYACLQ